MKYSSLLTLGLFCLFGIVHVFGLLMPGSFPNLGKRTTWINIPGRSYTTKTPIPLQHKSRKSLSDTIISPFDTSRTTNDAQLVDDTDDELPLTRENVERVLDEMRPYLKADGGNVELVEIDGPVVKLELVGACGTCPSSAMTMKMGLERKLKERIPEIADVVQSLPNAPEFNNNNLEIVLDGVRPFLNVAGGKISVEAIGGLGSMQPSVKLKMEGTAAALQSVKSEIMQRIHRHFMIAVRVEWV